MNAIQRLLGAVLLLAGRKRALAAALADDCSASDGPGGVDRGWCTGEEGGGAIGVGVRYGKGTLTFKGGGSQPVWWQGPSIGFDVGGNAANVVIHRMPASFSDPLLLG